MFGVVEFEDGHYEEVDICDCKKDSCCFVTSDGTRYKYEDNHRFLFQKYRPDYMDWVFITDIRSVMMSATNDGKHELRGYLMKGETKMKGTTRKTNKLLTTMGESSKNDVIKAIAEAGCLRPMTFEDKFKMDHPEYLESHMPKCPASWGYEKVEGLGHCYNRLQRCVDCWKREMPETKDKEEKQIDKLPNLMKPEDRRKILELRASFIGQFYGDLVGIIGDRAKAYELTKMAFEKGWMG